MYLGTDLCPAIVNLDMISESGLYHFYHNTQATARTAICSLPRFFMKWDNKANLMKCISFLPRLYFISISFLFHSASYLFHSYPTIYFIIFPAVFHSDQAIYFIGCQIYLIPFSYLFLSYPSTISHSILRVLWVYEETRLLPWISMIFSVALMLNFAFLPRKLIAPHGQGFRVSTYL